MKVSIMKITDHKTQTVFENCLADVNIPLGEVFTSPVLKKTTGVLNVSSVYLNDIKFNNLTFLPRTTGSRSFAWITQQS